MTQWVPEKDFAKINRGEIAIACLAIGLAMKDIPVSSDAKVAACFMAMVTACTNDGIKEQPGEEWFLTAGRHYDELIANLTADFSTGPKR